MWRLACDESGAAVKRSTLSHDPAKALERRLRREQRREAEPPRPEDAAREERRTAREAAKTAAGEDRDGQRAWSAAARKAGCAMCKATPVNADVRRERGADLARIEGHHLIEKSELRRWGLLAALFDPRNMLPLCSYHHARHTLAFERVPRELLPAAAFEFADEIGARFVLEDDRVYPRHAA